MPQTPSTASTTNHNSITGPNALPMRAVPSGCTANSTTSTATAMGST
jgi:hypothetical protein